jgi:hypothetical protein
MTSSRKRTASRVTRSISSQSTDHSPSSLWRANFETLSEPRLHASLGSSGCSPHGLVGLHHADLGRRVGGARVDAVDEDHARVARAPRRAHHALEDLARAQALVDLAVVRIDEVVVLALGRARP